jgi:hypothetical protein
MGYEYDSQVNRDLAKTAMDIYMKAHNIDQPINESKQNLNEEVIRENINGLIMNYISDVIILAEAEMGREMTDIEINEASDELLRRIDSISDEDKVTFINELSEAMGPSMQQAPAMSQAPAGAATPVAGGRPGTTARPSGMGVAGRPTAVRPGVGVRPRPNVPGAGDNRPTLQRPAGRPNQNVGIEAGGGFDVANYSPANYATAQEALDAMFADGFTNGQQIAMVLGQNWGGPSMGQG